MSGLTLRDVRKSYGETQVMHGVDLDIEDGEFVVFVGPSGCGKSTLLRMIAGLEEISDGTVAIGDEVVNDVAASKRGVAMVFQSYALYPHMTVYKNMAFGLKQAKTDPAEIDSRVRAAAEILQILITLTEAHATCPVVNASVLRSAARLFAIRKFSCSMNRCLTLMLRYVFKPDWKSHACMHVCRRQ